MFVLGFIINSASSSGGISNAAHFGGLVGGLLFGVLPESSRRNPRAAEAIWSTAGAISFVLWVTAIVFAGLCVARFWPQLSER